MSKLITVVDTDIEIAKDEEVLKGKKYYDGNRNLNTGKMENRGNLNLTVPAEGSLPLPAGYYDAGTITASKGNIEFGSVTDVIESGQINFSNVPGSGQTFTVNFTNEYTAEDKAFIDVWSCSLSNCTTAWVFYTVQDGPFIIGKSKQVTVQAYRPTDKVSGFCYYRVKKYS